MPYYGLGNRKELRLRLYITFLYYSGVKRSYELGLRIEPPKAKISDLSSSKK